jgi:hypothetical protein
LIEASSIAPHAWPSPDPARTLSAQAARRRSPCHVLSGTPPVGREAGFVVDDEVSNSPHPACTLAKSTPNENRASLGTGGRACTVTAG